MSQPLENDRVTQLEVEVGRLTPSVRDLTGAVKVVLDKVDGLISHVARLDAERGKIPTGTIFGTVSMVLGVFALVLSLTLSPVNERLDKLEEAGIKAATAEKQGSYWRGRIDERTERHDLQLLHRQSDSDGAQDARLTHLEGELERRRPYIYPGIPEAPPK